MTGTDVHLAGAAPEEGAAPAAAAFRGEPSVRGRVAIALAVLAVAVSVLWGVLASGNGRTLPWLIAQHELVGAVVGVSCGVVGAVVILHRPGHALGWLLLAEGQLQADSTMLVEYAAHRPALPLTGVASFIGGYVWLPGMAIAAGLFTPLFPDGRPASRRWRPLVWAAAAAVALASVAFLFVRDAAHPPAVPAALAVAGLLASLACGIIGALGLLVRMVRASGSQRRRIGWFFTAFAVVVTAQVLPVNALVPTVAAGLVPVALGVAMVRHRLFDGDRLLNRTLVYSILTVLVAGVFGLTVGVASNALGGHGTGAVVAAVVISLGLAPARTAVQHAVDRLLYGRRRDPYEALTGLGRQLSTAIAADDLLPTMVSTIAGALRLPYVAITLLGESAPAATHGQPVGATAEVELHHTGEVVGHLTIGLPPGQRFLDPGDERLLRDVAQQAGVAVAGVRLTHDLRRSRDALAVARDEERHRIRRDLHDGLGPTLAGVALGIGAARRSVAAAAPDTAELLGHLEAEVRESLHDVKRLVADLRPTTLEQLGLVEALRQYAETVTRRSQGTLKVQVDGSPLPALSTDVEIAAYRIVLEAVTNTTRHARAGQCLIRVSAADGQLRLAVHDDGVGLHATPHRAGLGLRSMAERATELGGSCTVGAAATGGTLVTALLPLTRTE
ncbi:MAG TPA: GAF domain-containing sensor histidine kinase [Dactylosporangium sp.]|nr:GAF domain-containing sensor histidine kinase [Dactylosporangium sp.]